ncbi:hypothetical protein EN868_11700 [Mesorhizobium sp. M2D.F.Ca.ET.225.01.1.1]|uniref:hypothetical protein n=1 Tax=unclassified Mesorhizobium TaxID=325217 RepID=UPI000FD493B4|nr:MULTISPECIES: hypothetical protein [unclassified Mesorhizobium]TGP55780.1 hypothetical protein EN869_025510 [Mesorhizobium sp. M2D.F.Ca.ET.226.01.1.1]TGP68238.1 hypothetical protein EN868_11700 [Mesorhizobium sp. M2D.F.Ca.ET.225.01.1.1]
MNNQAMTRRAALGALASLPAIAGATALPVALAAADPLADLIAEYRAKIAEFEAIPDEVLTKENEEALVQATYGPVSDRLYNNPPTPTSLRGVAEAMRHAIEDKAFCDHGDERLIAMALAFLDREVLS